ncbi:fatty acid desaturase family protein [Streptomyces sp. NPDC001530]|uniref:fatty acid desaturase family protein n=1 Tax=Streptomyces sp. NPDC001530 TaxID=3364582 RepID=UPI0036A4C4A5
MTETGTETGSDYSRLARQIAGAGLLERRPLYYAARFSVVGGSFCAAWVAFFLLGDTWLQLLVATVLAVLSGQIALLGHDLAHRQVCRTRRRSEAIGRVVANLGIGMSYGWWMDKHTRHHANPNNEDLDPDIQPNVLVWSQDQARASSGITRFVGGRQAYFYFPLLTLEGLNLHASAVTAVVKPGLRRRGLEAGLLAGHFACYLTALFLVLSPGKAVVFLLAHTCLWGVYMGLIFAPNHKGMPTCTGDEMPDFLRRQVLTSRNVRGNWLIDTALGGLNYQIEHHLFPSMPTAHLRRARPIVRTYCAQLGISYHETGLVRSYAEALREMHRVGAPIRTADA